MEIMGLNEHMLFGFISLALDTKFSAVLIGNRFQSSGLKAEMRYGKQIFPIHTLQLRSLIRTGWLSKVKKFISLGEELTSTMELASTLHQLLM